MYSDAEGNLIIWSMLLKKPAVYRPKAHEGAIISISSAPNNRLVTHGRDNAIRAWRLDVAGDDGAHGAALVSLNELFSVAVDALNFCNSSLAVTIGKCASTLDDGAVPYTARRY
ncbi:Astra associated protein 1 Asa1 [Spiromyces aspiralis]|uniref:Astra associated protein 1 Asa1 n=1 Tax=Spiromyces aspiralis TaxID=68401 RepID=A0ACC1HBT4_9FUNG|nr:Astra associated protein 1 Asa1 [Spiromyces aspiralis]